MAVPHAGVNRGDDPFAVGRVADVVKVMQRLGVDVLACVAARQMMKANALGVIICHVELRIFLRQEGDGLAVGRPALLACAVGHFFAAGAVGVHRPKTANRGAALAGIDEETYLRAVRRRLWIQLVDVGRVCEVGRRLAVSRRDEQLPVVVRVNLVDETELAAGQFLSNIPGLQSERLKKHDAEKER